MTDQHLADLPGVWTGRLFLDVRNNLDWAPAEIEVDIRLDVVIIRHAGGTVAVLDRDQWRAWLMHPDAPFTTDETTWSTQAGVTVLQVGQPAQFTVGTHSLANVLAVI